MSDSQVTALTRNDVLAALRHISVPGGRTLADQVTDVRVDEGNGVILEMRTVDATQLPNRVREEIGAALAAVGAANHTIASGASRHMVPISKAPTTEDVEEALRDVMDPELGINIVDLGLIYGLDLDENQTVTLDMTLTSAACPLTEEIEDQCYDALNGVVNGYRINWVWMPPWGPEHITEEGREQLRALGFNI